MCGICGIVKRSSGEKVKTETLKRMCQVMIHRGPDDEGIYLNGKANVGLGHRRLSIIDLSAAGHQPMTNEDNSVWLSFNGEIYNFKDLTDELKKKGHIFRSETDAEVIIHLYEELGDNCVKKLRGMFAFAIWDEKKERLFCARDRVGKKPFVYLNSNTEFCFASELNSLMQSGIISKKISLKALNYYLSFGYIPAPLTIFQDVFKLPPAHTLSLYKGKITISKYWELNYADKIKISEEDAASELILKLKEATRIRLYSDVPLGAFLSGGIDSSTAVALMSEMSDCKVKTFSIGFEDQDYSELKFAKNIANKFGTDHHEFIVKPKALEILPLLVERYGEPYADSSCVPTYYVAQQTRKYVTVALNGDGGDESFAGYERYQAMMLAESFQKLPTIIKNTIHRVSMLLPDSIDPRNKLRRVKRFLSGAYLSSSKRYARWVGLFQPEIKRLLYSKDLNFLADSNDPVDFIERYGDDGSKNSRIDSLLNIDVNTYLPYDLLVKMDIASMANSLEARSPFLDQDVMEFASRLPENYKIHKNVKKYLLKKAIKDFIPKDNIYRSKMGFGVPVGRWFRNELKDLLVDTLLSKRSLNRGYFRQDFVKHLTNQHLKGRTDYGHQLWTLLMLELWHKRFIDNNA